MCSWTIIQFIPSPEFNNKTVRGKLKTLLIWKSTLVRTFLYDKNRHACSTLWNGHRCDCLFQTHNSMEHLAMMEKVLGPIPSHLLEQTKWVRKATSQLFCSVFPSNLQKVSVLYMNVNTLTKLLTKCRCHFYVLCRAIFSRGLFSNLAISIISPRGTIPEALHCINFTYLEKSSMFRTNISTGMRRAPLTITSGSTANLSR